MQSCSLREGVQGVEGDKPGSYEAAVPGEPRVVNGPLWKQSAVTGSLVNNGCVFAP